MTITPDQPTPRFVEVVAQSIRVEMARNGVTQSELGDAIGLAQPALSRRLSGGTQWALSELLNVARFFKVPLSVITPDDLVEL